MTDSSSRAAVATETKPSAWSPLWQPLFRALWIAAVASQVGTWMHDVGASWLMTSLSADPFMVALIQAATSLPMFLLALPAGALADIVDRRRYLLGVQVAMLLVAITLALLTFLGMTSIWVLIGLTFALGIGAALNAPAWQAITPELVSREEMPAAVSLNSMGINVSRAVGPAVGGLIVAAAGPAAVFALNSLSFIGIILALYQWQRQPQQSLLPNERLLGAMTAGVRYVRGSRPMHAVLIRAIVFFS
jgi:MFS family permease